MSPVEQLRVLARKIPLPAALAVLVLAVLVPVLRGGFVNYDDGLYVLANPALRGSWTATLAFSPGYYHPLVTLLYKAEFSLFGLAPLPYHVTNLALHLANCVSLFYLFLLLGWRRGAAFLGALLFGVHPVHVEPVAWISGRKELLWGLFSFWSLGAYLKYADTGRSRFYFISLGCFVLACLSKPFALALAFAIPLADLYRRRGFSAVILLEKVPYFLAAFSLALLSWAPAGFLLRSGAPSLSPADFAGLLAENLLFYLEKLVLPVKLAAMYPPPAFPVTASAWLFLFLAAAAALYAGWRLLRGDQAAEPGRAAVFCTGFSLLAILPALLVFPPADRYNYVPAAGLFFLYSYLVWRLYDACSALARPALYRAALIVLAGAHCATLGAASFQRASVWKDSLSLSGDILEKYPLEPMAYCLRAGALYSKGETAAALADYDRALALSPEFAPAVNNRRALLEKMGKPGINPKKLAGQLPD